MQSSHRRQQTAPSEQQECLVAEQQVYQECQRVNVVMLDGHTGLYVTEQVGRGFICHWPFDDSGPFLPTSMTDGQGSGRRRGKKGGSHLDDVTLIQCELIVISWR